MIQLKGRVERTADFFLPDTLSFDSLITSFQIRPYIHKKLNNTHFCCTGYSNKVFNFLWFLVGLLVTVRGVLNVQQTGMILL